MPAQLSWIVCPVVCADPTHVFRISIDSTGKIRTIATDCDRADLDLANALGTPCCRRAVAHCIAYIRAADYDARTKAQRDVVESLCAFEHVRAVIRYVLGDARELSSSRPKRAADIAAEYAPKYAKGAYSAQQKVYEYNRAIARMPEFTDLAQFRMERSWTGGWAQLCVDGAPVATIYQREGGVSQAVMLPLPQFTHAAKTTSRLAGKRHVTVCMVCGRSCAKGHNSKVEHTTNMWALTRRLLNRLGFDVKS